MFKVTDPKSRRHSLATDSHAEQIKAEIPVPPTPKLSFTYQADFSKDQAGTSEQSTTPKKEKKQKTHCPLPSIGLTRRFRTDTQPTENIQLKSYTRNTSKQPQIALTSSSTQMPTEHQKFKHHLPPARYKTHIQTITLPPKPKLALTYQADFSKATTVSSKTSPAPPGNRQILRAIPLPKPPLPRHLYPIQEEAEVQLDSYIRRPSTPEIVLSPPSHEPAIIAPDVSTATTSMAFLPNAEQPAITEHEQLYRTLSTSASYRSESSSTRSGKLMPTAGLSTHEYENILAWFWGWTRENCRFEKIDEEALLKVRQKIQEIHDHKGYRLLGKKRNIWDIRASYQYQQAALDFYAAAGISRQQERTATLHWAKSGEFYALTQLFLFPIRIMRPLFDVPGFDTTAAKGSLNFARGILHANIAGFLSPAFDVLAAFTKKGKPYPSSIYWKIPSHYGVVKQLGHCIGQISKLLDNCRQQQIPVPAPLLDYLEHARHLYKMANAKTYCYSAASTVSSVTESLKGIIDASLALISGGFLYSVSNIITTGASSLIYCLSGPCEELSSMNQIRLQNAKYADILNSKGEIDKNKVMTLWHDPHQVDQAYIEQIFCQQTAEYLYKLHRAKRRKQFFETILAHPYDQAQQINTQKIVYEEEISFLRKQIAVIKPETHKQQRSDIDLLLFLRKNVRDEKLLRLSATAYAREIDAEYNKYLPEQGKSLAIDKRLNDLLALKQLVNSPPHPQLLLTHKR